MCQTENISRKEASKNRTGKSVVNGGKQQSSTCLPCDSEGEGLRDQTGGVTVSPICGCLFMLDYQRVQTSC